MGLTPAEQRNLDMIGAALLRTDPGLSRRLGASRCDVQNVSRPHREVGIPDPVRRNSPALLGVLAVWLVLGLLPLLLGVVLSIPVLIGVGVGVTIFGLPLAVAPWAWRA